MQFNGIGGEHDAQLHHVTSCVHDHAHYKTEAGPSAGLRPGNAAAPQEAQTAGESFSLSSWLERTFGRGGRFLKGIWNGGDTGVQGAEGNHAGMQVLTGIIEDDAGEGRSQQAGAAGTSLNTAQIAAASVNVTPAHTLPASPYFAPVEDSGRARETLWHKLKTRCRDVTGQLTRHLPGKFFSARNQSSFQPGQEKRREDLRKHSKYREDTLEIDCVLTDDSYLLDSYDRKGEYSRLSAKK